VWIPRLITEINFFPEETIVRLEDGVELVCATEYPDGKKMTLEEFRNTYFLIEHQEIYVNKIQDN
jgi:hypothetical protein